MNENKNKLFVYIRRGFKMGKGALHIYIFCSIVPKPSLLKNLGIHSFCAYLFSIFPAFSSWVISIWPAGRLEGALLDGEAVLDTWGEGGWTTARLWFPRGSSRDLSLSIFERGYLCFHKITYCSFAVDHFLILCLSSLSVFYFYAKILWREAKRAFVL